MIRCEIAISGGLSSISKVGCAKVQLPDGCFIADLKFVDQRSVIMIIRDPGKPIPHLLIPLSD